VGIYGYLGICGVQFHGSRASKASTLEACGKRSSAWRSHALERLPTASSVEDYEALLPWNYSPVSHS